MGRVNIENSTTLATESSAREGVGVRAETSLEYLLGKREEARPAAPLVPLRARDGERDRPRSGQRLSLPPDGLRAAHSRAYCVRGSGPPRGPISSMDEARKFPIEKIGSESAHRRGAFVTSVGSALDHTKEQRVSSGRSLAVGWAPPLPPESA